MEQVEWRNGEITLDSEMGKALGFTSDKFDGWLWKTSKYIKISMIISKHGHHGHFTELVEKITSFGFGVRIPGPFPYMESWAKKRGFVAKWEYWDYMKCWQKVMILRPGKVAINVKPKIAEVRQSNRTEGPDNLSETEMSHGIGSLLR